MIGPITWFYDLIVYLYAFSVLFYFADFINHNPRANRIAFIVLTLVWVLQTAFFVLQTFTKEYLPVVTQFEILFFYSWLLVTLSLVINYFFKIDFFVFFTNIMGFVIMVLNLFSNPNVGPKVSEDMSSHLMFIHITLALLSYAAFSVSAIFALMYLIQNHLLKEKKWTPLLRRLPSIGQLEDYSYLLASVGVPLLLLSLILGIVWAYIVLPEVVWFDPKVIFSVLVLAAYSVFIYGKVVSGWYGKKLALWNLAAFATVFINYLLSESLSLFHQWL